MIRFELQHEALRLGVVRAGRVRCAPSSAELDAELSRAESNVRADQAAFPEVVRAAIRDVLRKGATNLRAVASQPASSCWERLWVRVTGLPVICRGPSQQAIGNAVKDSMHAKVHEGTHSLLAVVYGSAVLGSERLKACCDELAHQLTLHAQAGELELAILPSG